MIKEIKELIEFAISKKSEYTKLEYYFQKKNHRAIAFRVVYNLVYNESFDEKASILEQFDYEEEIPPSCGCCDAGVIIYVNKERFTWESLTDEEVEEVFALLI